MQQEIVKASASGRYTLNTTPTHSHTGIDSPKVEFADILDKQFFAVSTVFGTSAATATNYGTFWIAPFNASVQEMQITYAHQATNPCVIYVEILKPGHPSGSGIGVQGFNVAVAGGVDQVGTSKLRAGSKAAILSANDRLSLFVDGDPTGLVQLNITVLLQIID